MKWDDVSADICDRGLTAVCDYVEYRKNSNAFEMRASVRPGPWTRIETIPRLHFNSDQWVFVDDSNKKERTMKTEQEIRIECANRAVAAVNFCRGRGESDLRSVRSWVVLAITDPTGYEAEAKEGSDE